MKKILLLSVLVILLTGCSSNMTYEFNEESISSKASVEFNQEEFKKYINSNMVHTEERFKTEESTEEFIDEKYEEGTLIAVQKDDLYKYYEKDKYTKKDKKYIYSYKYDFKYDDFVNNYYLNECFDYFFVTEDEDFIHYNISGSYTCSDVKNMSLTITSNKKQINSNSENVENDKHNWNIKEKDNNIKFSVSKDNKVEENKFIKPTYIIGLILILGLIVLAFIYHKLTKKND